MVVLNATGAAPIPFLKNSICSDRRSEPKRLPSPSSAFSLRRFSEGLASLSSVLGAASSARAFTYEDLLEKTLGSSGEFDLEGIADGVLKFSSENPLILAGGASVVVVITLIVSQILGSSKAWGVKSAKDAFAMLKDDASAQLLDIREGKEIKEAGSPDLRGLKKNRVAIAYQEKEKARFLKKLDLKFKDPGNTTLFILDKFDGNSELVAELVTTKGFKAAYAINGGAEGARGWKNSGLPWSPPKKTLFLDFGDLRDAIEMIGKAILTTKTSSQASPPDSVSSDTSFTETKADKKEGSPELTQAVNSVSIAELEEKAASKPKISRF